MCNELDEVPYRIRIFSLWPTSPSATSATLARIAPSRAATKHKIDITFMNGSVEHRTGFSTVDDRRVSAYVQIYRSRS
jgi:hypothetical protein